MSSSIEEDVGISCYITSTPPLSAILKQRQAHCAAGYCNLVYEKRNLFIFDESAFLTCAAAQFSGLTYASS